VAVDYGVPQNCGILFVIFTTQLGTLAQVSDGVAEIAGLDNDGQDNDGLDIDGLGIGGRVSLIESEKDGEQRIKFSKASKAAKVGLITESSKAV